MRSNLCRLFALSMFLTFCGSIIAAPAAKPEVKNNKPAAEAIRKALDASGNFDFTGVNLAGVINTLSEQYKINIVLDRAVITMMGLEPEVMNIELKMKEGKLRNALRTMVGQYNLTYAIVGDSLLITTEEVAVYRQLKQRINVDFESVPLNKAMKDISTKYGVNVVFDPRTMKSKAAENPVTLQVDDVPFEAAVRLMCEMAELKPARMGNVIFVTTEARADRLKDGDSLVPTPAILNPMIPGLPGGIGGLGGVAPGVALAPPIVAPAVADKPDAKKDEAKPDEPKKEGE